MNCIGTYDGTIFYNPANKFCIVSVKTADQSVPAEARSNRRYKDHLIRFTAVGYEIPRTDAVELELDGEWAKGKYGVQLQVEQWREIVPRTKNGVEGYLASGLIKGIGPKTAADIVERFGVDTLDILEHQPERLLEIRGITENKLEDIKASYAENRMLQGIMTLLAPFKITPKTALKIYQYFGPTSVEILEKSPFELCQISGFGFRRVDAIVQKSGGNLHDPMRIKGAVFCALDEGKSKRGHLYISSEELEKSALKLLNEKIPVPELRLHQQEVRDMMQEMILNGAIVSVKDNIYLPRVFAQEDETARRIAQRLVAQMPVEHIAPVLEQVKVEMGLRLSAQQEAAVYAAFRHGLSVITGSPGTGKTTVLRTILEVYRRLYPDGKIALMAPTGRASRRMSESTGFEDARTLHSGLGLTSEEDEGSRNRKSEPLSADLIIVDEFSIVNAAIAVAQKRPYSAIQSTDHTLGRFPLEPGIHILRQQFWIIGKHTVIVSSRNLQMCADLPMGDLVDLQWLHQWGIMVVKGMEIKLRTKRFYLKSPGIKQIVLLEFGLAFNLLCHFHDGKS